MLTNYSDFAGILGLKLNLIPDLLMLLIYFHEYEIMLKYYKYESFNMRH